MIRALFCLLLALAAPALAQPADTILTGGRILRFDAPPAEAIAIRGQEIAALGTAAEIAALAGPATRIIPLAGRSVIPGLIDSHIHAIRAGAAWGREVSWISAASIAEALARLSTRAAATPPEEWLIVAGGWSPDQFAEARLPRREEIEAAAPGRRVYIQLFYTQVFLSPAGEAALGLAPGGALERTPEGWWRGPARAVSQVFDRLPPPDAAAQRAGTRAFLRELNRLGVTGVLDPGGYNLPPEAYQPVLQLWRDGGLTLRLRYSLCAPRRGKEAADFAALTALLPMGFGDDWLRFNGIGETITWGMYDNDAPSAADRAQLAEVLRWARARGLTATFHWNNDRSVPYLLEVLEAVNAEAPIAPLRWSIAHLNDASAGTLRRMRALGLGWLVQNGFYFRGEAFIAARGAAALGEGLPPIMTAARLGIPLGAGTDAHRVMSHNPFVALRWLLDGRTAAGLALRGPGELPDRMQALRFYTEGSAWFSFEETRRGGLVPGRLADLAVLSADYLSVPVEAIGAITSLLTMVDGRIVFAAGPYAALEEGPDQAARSVRSAR